MPTKCRWQWPHSPSPEAAFLLVSTKNRDLLRGPTPEVRDSRTFRHSAYAQSQVWQIWMVLVSIYCVNKAIQNRNVFGQGQRSRFLVLTKGSAASGDENGDDLRWKKKLKNCWGLVFSNCLKSLRANAQRNRVNCKHRGHVSKRTDLNEFSKVQGFFYQNTAGFSNYLTKLVFASSMAKNSRNISINWHSR